MPAPRPPTPLWAPSGSGPPADMVGAEPRPPLPLRRVGRARPRAPRALGRSRRHGLGWAPAPSQARRASGRSSPSCPGALAPLFGPWSRRICRPLPLAPLGGGWQPEPGARTVFRAPVRGPGRAAEARPWLVSWECDSWDGRQRLPRLSRLAFSLVSQPRGREWGTWGRCARRRPPRPPPSSVGGARRPGLGTEETRHRPRERPPARF